MGDMADWIIEQGMNGDDQEKEIASRAKDLEVSQLVLDLRRKLFLEESIELLDKSFHTLVNNICDWYHRKGWVSPAQRGCLESAWVDLYFVPVGEDNA